MASASRLLFTVVSETDVPIYSVDLADDTSTQEDARRGMDDHLHQLVTRGALDFADERSWESSSTNLRVVDRFNDLNAYAYCCATRTRFVLLTDARADESVRAFFADVHEAYAVAVMNPLLDANAPLEASFGDAVRLAARRRLGAGR